MLNVFNLKCFENEYFSDKLYFKYIKGPDCAADPLHTFMGICGLSLVNYPTLEPIHPALVISMRAFQHLQNLHRKWSESK